MAKFVVADGIAGLIEPLVGETAAYVVAWLVLALVLVGGVLGVGGIMSYVMRKVMARMQTRVGPNRVGPFGLLQFLADGLKLISKEDLMPARADPWGFRMAPFFVILPIILAFAPLPFSDGVLISDVRVGLLFVVAISAASPIGELIAGWASNNKYSMYGALRAAAMDVSYEVPLVLTIVSVVLLASAMGVNGLNFMDVVAAQDSVLWFVLLQPIGAFIFFASALAKAGVVPTDLAEAESELVAGFFTEYSGMRFGVFFVGLFVNIVLISVLTVLLFFGGWTIPYVSGALVAAGLTGLNSALGFLFFIAKVAVVVLFVLITWFTLPRFRPDQFLALGWKALFPLAVLNLVITLVEIRYVVPLLAGGA